MLTSGRHGGACLLLLSVVSMQLSVIEYPERVREAKDYESEVDQVAISHEEKALATELVSSMGQSIIDLDNIRNPRTLRLSILLEDRVKMEILSKNSEGNSENNSTEANSRDILDPHSALVCALRNALVSVENRKIPRKSHGEDRSGDCKKTG